MPERKGPADVVDQIKAYARQETIEPLRPLPRWVLMGIGGSVLLMLGSISLVLALLRVLQEETGNNFTGNLSWAPYLITLGVSVIILALLGLRISKRSL
ncbi:MAG: hypothetical protein P8J50_10350 [Acidimicrobiales bacterium]|jgi:hypothetical protein|nr:hypothetical protein [Acidimicrobiales bacterium]